MGASGIRPEKNVEQKAEQDFRDRTAHVFSQLSWDNLSPEQQETLRFRSVNATAEELSAGANALGLSTEDVGIVPFLKDGIYETNARVGSYNYQAQKKEADELKDLQQLPLFGPIVSDIINMSRGLRRTAGREKEDGRQFLKIQVKNGIVTPLYHARIPSFYLPKPIGEFFGFSDPIEEYIAVQDAVISAYTVGLNKHRLKISYSSPQSVNLREVLINLEIAGNYKATMTWNEHVETALINAASSRDPVQIALAESIRKKQAALEKAYEEHTKPELLAAQRELTKKGHEKGLNNAKQAFETTTNELLTAKNANVPEEIKASIHDVQAAVNALHKEIKAIETGLLEHPPSEKNDQDRELAIKLHQDYAKAIKELKTLVDSLKEGQDIKDNPKTGLLSKDKNNNNSVLSKLPGDQEAAKLVNDFEKLQKGIDSLQRQLELGGKKPEEKAKILVDKHKNEETKLFNGLKELDEASKKVVDAHQAWKTPPERKEIEIESTRDPEKDSEALKTAQEAAKKAEEVAKKAYQDAVKELKIKTDAVKETESELRTIQKQIKAEINKTDDADALKTYHDKLPAEASKDTVMDKKITELFLNDPDHKNDDGVSDPKVGLYLKALHTTAETKGIDSDIGNFVKFDLQSGYDLQASADKKLTQVQHKTPGIHS